MEGPSTDPLRALAPKWSLAGDNQLLDLLQNTHQKIVSKCQDVNSKLEEMASALDNASIHLQNVNNKFMALSNSQFIESRVYDDDEHLIPEPLPIAETPQPSTMDELSMLKSSLSILERAHDTTEILDDSDSDSDAEISVVLKPKDMYPERPLPYIIGTQPWKNKWHAGLIVEESDSESSTSQNERRDEDLYSESASEAEEIAGPRLEGHTISESSSFNFEQAVESPPGPQKPSDIAAELARRLGGNLSLVVQEKEEYNNPVPAVKKVYRPEKPAAGIIFPDEPPPLDTYQQEESQSDEDDIFAEINKNKPYAQRNIVQNNLADDLFSFEKPEAVKGDIFSDFAPVEKNSAEQKPSLFEDESEPDLFAEPPTRNATQNKIVRENQEETSTKRPVGGISLFGSNKGTESIGAAILKRNQRKSSTSGDESGSDNIQNQNIEEKPKKVPENIENPKAVAKSKAVDETDNKSAPKKEKDIFDDLFAKSKTVPEKKPVQKIIKEPVNDKEKTPVKDLFSDNIFDDIDDIFTSDVKMPTKESNQKSIFDDDDDLFSEIAKPISKDEPTSCKVNQKASSKIKENIFDSDDDLFSEIKNKPVANNTESHSIKDDKRDVNEASNENYNQEPIAKIENIIKPTETTKERNLFDDSPQNIRKPDTKQQAKSKSIFDSDSDEDIFAKIKTSDDKKPNKTENVHNSNIIPNTNPVNSENILNLDNNTKQSIGNLKIEGKANIIKSPSLFEDDIDDLFVNANKINTDSKATNEAKIAEFENISKISVTKDSIIDKDTNTANEDSTLPNADSIVNDNVSNTIINNKQNLQEKSPLATAEQSDIFDDNLLEDDMFSTAKEPSKMSHRQIDTEEVVSSKALQSNQDISESRTNMSNGSSSEQTVLDKTNFYNTGSREKVQVVETNESEKDTNQSVFDDFRELIKEEEAITSLQKNPISNESNIFDDIFTEPPAFEKPVEPKKSKNVNALFDDDSDDESVFFKKNDVISDEKPETFSKNANFDIFVDEPPAIDVDFTTKSTKNIDIDDNDDDLFSSVPKIERNVPKPAHKLDISNSYEDLFSTVPDMHEIVPDSVIPETKEEETKAANSSYEVAETNLVKTPITNTDITKKGEKIANTIGKVNESDEDLFSNFLKPEISQSNQKGELLEQSETLKSNVIDTNKPGDKVENMFDSTDLPIKGIESKKIGKLNTKNFNINVNALIPGASPKKVPKESRDEYVKSESYNVPKTVKLFPDDDEADNYEPKSASVKVESESNGTRSEGNEPKAAKSITFDDKTESGVLDNNLSKQRPKIQVKRRPSSRRARHEAVRKSGIGFGDDTDNSSSFDEPVKSKSVRKEDSQNIKVIQKDNDVANPIQNCEQDKSNDSHQKESTDEITAKTNLFNNSDPNVTASLVKDIKDLNEPSVSCQTKTETKDFIRNIDGPKRTTKIVYILNDEDIFNTGPTVAENKSENEKKNIDIKNEDDIFKDIEGIKTLGRTYTENTEKATEITKKDVTSIEIARDVAENSDKTVIKDVKTKQTAKTSLFDDSDEELFSENRKVVKKTALFDSDSEEDLFKKKTEKQNKEQKNRKVKERIEVNVKGSLFGDEDDDDELFGVKKEKNEPNRESSAPSTSKETASTASKSAAPMFDDPLSMLGDD